MGEYENKKPRTVYRLGFCSGVRMVFISSSLIVASCTASATSSVAVATVSPDTEAVASPPSARLCQTVPGGAFLACVAPFGWRTLLLY